MRKASEAVAEFRKKYFSYQSCPAILYEGFTEEEAACGAANCGEKAGVDFC